jgi:hypothetical protein
MKHTIRFLTTVARTPARKKLRQRLKAAALAIGLATAWGGEANAEVLLQLDISPTRTLRDAYVYYANNISSARFISLGTLPENETSTFYHLLDGQFDDAPQKLLPTSDRPNVGYWVIGVYDEENASGIGVSFRNETVVSEGTPWSSVFFGPNEQTIAGALTTSSFLDFTFRSFIDMYGNPSYTPSAKLPTHYGEYSTLVNFSDATYGGTAIARIVPEPSSIILVGAAGVFLVGGVLRRRVSEPCN